MRRKLPAGKKEEAENMLLQGMSVKETVKASGLSMSTVYKINAKLDEEGRFREKKQPQQLQKESGHRLRTRNDQRKFYISHY